MTAPGPPAVPADDQSPTTRVNRRRRGRPRTDEELRDAGRHPYLLAIVAASPPGGALLTDHGAIIWRDDDSDPAATT